MNKYENRLYQEWYMHGKIVIAVDFDDTISPWKFKSKEDLIDLDRTINILKIAKQIGAFITVWTACDKSRYEEIKTYCEEKGLDIDTINENPIDLPYGKERKMYANIFIDDRAGINEALSILEFVMYKLRSEKESKRLDYPGALG